MVPQSILAALRHAYQENQTLCGVIANRVEDGIMIYVADIVGFLPNEQLPSSYSHRAYKGHEIYVKITNLEREGRGRVYLSLESLPNLIDLSSSGNRVRQCEKCHHKISRSYSVCPDCRYKRLTRSPPPPRIVQGGSPGLKKKRTLQVAKEKRKNYRA